MWRLLLCLVFLPCLLLACEPDEPNVKFEDLPDGDPVRGAELFNRTTIEGLAGCGTCHREGGVGPEMTGFGDRADERVEGQNAKEYTFNSIIRPARYLVSGYSNLMVSDYGNKLSAQDIADLIAYLLSQ